mmetsp:Transcript_18328/g.21193  ORF Transcript_18328/g.21193 Transcript_18328/m.21193 type:complete len:96 (-) Transcript_18328:1224-1511(-)
MPRISRTTKNSWCYRNVIQNTCVIRKFIKKAKDVYASSVEWKLLLVPTSTFSFQLLRFPKKKTAEFPRGTVLSLSAGLFFTTSGNSSQLCPSRLR